MGIIKKCLKGMVFLGKNYGKISKVIKDRDLFGT